MRRGRLIWVFGLMFLAAIFVPAAEALGVLFSINNLDGPGEGFNDPVLGSARLDALTYAANIWGDALAEAYPGETITIDAKMDPLGGSETRATLGTSSPKTFYSDFSSSDPAFVSDTWYADALANHLHGSDLNPSSGEMSITFNSDLDSETVLGSIDWYYGFDCRPGIDIDFVTVSMHEICHGLHFLDMLNSKGLFARNSPGIYDRFLSSGDGTPLVDMSVPQRKSAVVSGDVFWSGTAGTAGNDGQAPKIYAPNPYESASSLSHLDEDVHENELMSPFYSGVDHFLNRMELGMLEDMGWDVVYEPLIPGDFNRDGLVTDADYTIWANTYLSTTDLRADANVDG